jgi:outer membrane receptor protein involved in Fe transport
VRALLAAQDTVDFNNHFDSQTYIDLDLRYNVGPFTLLGSVTNLLDVSPKYVTNVAAVNSDVIGTYMPVA